ncbi:MAG: LPXTG cell wall anchor domain-containing protein [Lachnospiraceae bacterium]|nr:LPXTG cell wall anchor domain-containing protein [Lachnospiraceae bacterium]
MKRFSKALSLLVAAAVLMASVSTSASAATVSSVEQTVAPTVEEVTGLEDASSLEITTIVDVPEERKEALETAHNTLNDIVKQSNATANNGQSSSTQVVGQTAVQQFVQAVTGMSQVISQSTIAAENRVITVNRVFDLHTDEEPTGAVSITVDTQDMGIEPQTLVALLHSPDDGTSWEVIDYGTTDANGKITFNDIFKNGHSPYAIVSISDVTVTTTKTSPQTGETVNALLIAAIALAAVASVVAVSGKKAAR